MTCELVQPFLDAYVDGELDTADRFKVEAHLTYCDACTRRRGRLEALRSAIAAAPRYTAPDALRQRIHSGLRDSSPSPIAPGRVMMKPIFDWRWAAIAASVLLAAVALWQIQLRPRQNPETLIAREVVSSHVRSLMANHLVDEPSSDQHTVKPWFAGKLDFSPVVKNLDAQGFMVAGGRLDYLDNRPVAAIVYRRRQHVINLFAWPSPQGSAEPRDSTTVNGYNTVSWRSGGMRYWAVSDLNRNELESFARLYAAD
jgi:anti-sigma factor RsiW